MSKGLKAFNSVKTTWEYNIPKSLIIVQKDNMEIIEKELKDYQEIREIAKRYNWDDITSEIFNVKTDKKYRDLFNSAIVDIQKDYRKARAIEIIEAELGIELVTLFKALTDTIAIKNKDGTINVMWACPRFQISIDKSDSWILYGPVEEQKYVSIKDYGKTWALTKEELE